MHYKWLLIDALAGALCAATKETLIQLYPYALIKYLNCLQQERTNFGQYKNYLYITVYLDSKTDSFVVHDAIAI
jgi:hypothetical protein